jgi:malonyl CoA-acyl carrier protein transacylase
VTSNSAATAQNSATTTAQQQHMTHLVRHAERHLAPVVRAPHGPDQVIEQQQVAQQLLLLVQSHLLLPHH